MDDLIRLAHKAIQAGERAVIDWQSVAIDPDNPDLTQLADLPDVQGRWAFPYQGVRHESMGGDKMHSWGVHPTDAPAVWKTPPDQKTPRVSRDTIFYDPARVNIDIDPDWLADGFTRPRINGLQNRVGDLQEKIPGIIWRGMSDEEYQQAKQRGYFQSTGDANFTELGQNGVTCFSDEPDTACSYASNYAPFQYMPTFTRPGHVIGIPDQNYPRNSVNEIEVPGQVPFDAITHHYRGDVAAIRAGEFGGYQSQPNPEYGYNGFEDRPSRKLSPSVMMQWVADHPRKAKVGKMIRLSAYSERLLNKLQAEFNGWYQTHPHPITVDSERGPIGHWPHVESFLADRYPEAYRGFSSGMEEAGVTLDPNLKGWGIPPLARSYETGPEAMADYGYDPAEVVAGMLLLHNRSHGFRGDLESADIKRLNDIAKKRHQMQQDADQRQLVTAATMNFDLAEDLAGEFDDWYEQNKEAQELELMPERGGPIGSWPNIELFLKDRYPAAHRNLAMGDELSRPLMDRGETPKYRNEKDQHPPRANPAEESLNVPYETGPEALAKYGYDPKEITAAMLLLHDDSHIGRTLLKRDQNRLNDIARGRHKMQEAYEKAHHAIRLAENTIRKIAKDLSKSFVRRLNKEFDQWHASLPDRDDWPTSIGVNGWSNVERFLKDRYPASHRGHEWCMEQAQKTLDSRGFVDDNGVYRHKEPYETGPEAEATYGYDPKAVAAGMMLLHHNSNGGIRRNYISYDEDLLADIFQKRVDMQEKARQRKLVNANRIHATDDQYSLENIWKDFQDWWKPFGDRSYRAKDSIQSWGTVEEYLMDRHGLDPYDEATFSHPVTLTMSKLHSLAQSRPWVDGQEGTEDYLLKDSDLLTGAALGLLKIRRNQKTKKLEPDNPEDEDY